MQVFLTLYNWSLFVRIEKYEGGIAEMSALVKVNPVEAETRLRAVGLRPTRQRMALAGLLFAKGDRHLTVEELHGEAIDAGESVSLATVYNTLHQFTQAGLIRVLAIESSKTYFDTNTSDHHHFFVEDESEVLDIPVSNLAIDNLPEVPEGMEIAHVDVVIRLRHKKA
jgi:Fur family iron response transcriptional regulator